MVVPQRPGGEPGFVDLVGDWPSVDAVGVGRHRPVARRPQRARVGGTGLDARVEEVVLGDVVREPVEVEHPVYECTVADPVLAVGTLRVGGRHDRACLGRARQPYGDQ